MRKRISCASAVPSSESARTDATASADGAEVGSWKSAKGSRIRPAVSIDPAASTGPAVPETAR